MEKKMEHEMEAGFIERFMRFPAKYVSQIKSIVGGPRAGL